MFTNPQSRKPKDNASTPRYVRKFFERLPPDVKRQLTFLGLSVADKIQLTKLSIEDIREGLTMIKQTLHTCYNKRHFYVWIHMSSQNRAKWQYVPPNCKNICKNEMLSNQFSVFMTMTLDQLLHWCALPTEVQMNWMIFERFSDWVMKSSDEITQWLLLYTPDIQLPYDDDYDDDDDYYYDDDDDDDDDFNIPFIPYIPNVPDNTRYSSECGSAGAR